VTGDHKAGQLTDQYRVPPSQRTDVFSQQGNLLIVVPVRIARGVTGKATWHAQAQAQIDGKWCWLGVEETWVVITGKDGFYPVEYYTLQEYFNKTFGAK
jgi:hypothetical protein